MIVSQVIRYLRRLHDTFEVCHLLTLERDEMPRDEEDTIARGLAESGIHWHPLVARRGKRAMNVWREIYGGNRMAIKLIREHELNIVHARSFIPGNIALQACRKTGAKLLYDMRGFWAEEKWAKGTIRQPWMRGIAQRMENRLFRRADALVSLTEVGKQRLESQGVTTPIDVIPCCVDTDKFRWDGDCRNEVKRIVSVGSLGPGYLPEAVFGVFAAAQKEWPGARLQLVTRSSGGKIEAAAKAAGCDRSRIDVASAEPSDVPRYLSEADLGLCMIQPSTAKIASSPTKLAEYFACGVPVIANCNGIGDMAQIVLGKRVGVNVETFDKSGYELAVGKAKELLADSDLSRRCRALAEKEFSVDVGSAIYAAIYERLVA